MNFNQYLSRIAPALAIALFAPALLVAYVDPFQIFHKSYLTDMGLINNQRFQNAGLINSYLLDPIEGYDSVMIGSSVSTNFTSAAARSGLGWNRALRLFMDGGDPSQLALILSRALDTRKVQHVLWEIHPRAYSPPRYFRPTSDWGFPDYLYNNNILDDLRYIFNYDVVKLAWLATVNPGTRPDLTPDSLGYMASNPLASLAHQQLNSAASLQGLQSTFQNRPLTAREEQNLDLSSLEYPVLEQIVFPVLSQWCNTDIEFVLFIPPISKIDYLANPKFVLRSIYMTHTLLKQTENCRNIRLHAFDTMSFTGDLNNYMDKMHYRLNVSEQILALMGKHENIITRDNFEKYKNDFILSVDNYQVYSSYPGIKHD
jgi:hypothetical protein